MEKLSIGISMPVLNERDNIEPILLDIRTALEGHCYTVCIVDDGSKDGTVEIIEELMSSDDRIWLIKGVKKRYGCQRGAASRSALEWLVKNTEHEVVVELDADGAQRPAELINGATQVSILDYDVAIASKYVYGSKVIGRTVRRRFVSIFYSTLARLLLDHRIRDYSNGYRFYSRKAAKFLLNFTPKYTSPVYLLEILVSWLANDFRIIEIPTMYVEREDGRSKVKFVDMIYGFLGTLDLAFKYHCKYFQVNERT